MALEGLNTNVFNDNAAETTGIFELQEDKYEVNSLLTKSVVQIIGDVLKQFTAILPMNSDGFKKDSISMRTSANRKYNFDSKHQDKIIKSLFTR